MLYETKGIPNDELYKLLIGSVMPRPIAWVGSVNEKGIANLAPFSFFTVASIQPPIIAISIMNKNGGSHKDSLKNIQSAECFSVSMVSHENAKAMAITSTEVDSDINEFELANLTELPCSFIDSVRCKEAQVSFECTLRDVQSFGDSAGAGNLILAEVVAIHVDDDVLDGYKIDSDKVDLIGRMAGANYATTRGVFQIE